MPRKVERPLTNAEKQARFRERRDAYLRQVPKEELQGLIERAETLAEEAKILHIFNGLPPDRPALARVNVILDALIANYRARNDEIAQEMRADFGEQETEQA